MRYVISFLLLAHLPMLSVGQDLTGHRQMQGRWFSPENPAGELADWEAQWIWLSEDVASDVMLARRTFELLELPDRAELRITASSQYQLYLNGQYVGRGPARSAPHHQSFDLLDIRDQLRAGRNVLAVRVHHQKGKFAYHLPGRAGLLAQLELTEKTEVTTIVSDKEWMVNPDPSWDQAAPRISRFQLVVSDRVDLRRQIRDWRQLSFDDRIWSHATPLMRTSGWPAPQENARPQTLTPPWTTLAPRDIPYLSESSERATTLIAAGSIATYPAPLNGRITPSFATALPAYQKGEAPLVIPATATLETYLLVFDLGQLRNGMPQLDIEGPAGAQIDILCAPFVVNQEFNHQVVDSEFQDRIILSGERDEWEATYFKPVRYLGIRIQSGTAPVKIYRAGIRHMVYPFESTGRIHSTDAAWVDQYMQATAGTIRACTTDGYTDNYRERRQYAQTGYYAALGNYYLFGDHALQRRYLLQVAQEQEANGMMPAYAPLAMDDCMIILDSNCLWVRSLRNYLLYSGDRKTVAELLPAARKLMGLLHTYTNSLGMIYNPPYPYWLDHALNDRRGANFTLNGHYLGALEDFAQVLAWLGEPDHQVYRERAGLLRQSLRGHLWDEEQGLFADAWIEGNRSDQFSEHANAMALAMRVATSEQAELVARQILAPDRDRFIKRASGMTVVTPAMSYFLHKGLCQYGYVEASFQLFRQRFDQMLAPGTNGTLWEEWWLDGTGRSGKFQGGRTRSDAQTESAFSPALFAEFLLGMHPTAPGMKVIEVARPAAGIRQIEGLLPTPAGQLQIEWRLNEKNGGELALTIPETLQVKLDLELLQQSSPQSIRLNGREIPSETRGQSFVMLSEGSHRISF